MSFPIYFDILGLHISAHQVFELIAYAAGFQFYLYLRRKWPKGPPMTLEQTAWVMLGAIFGALIGSKLLAWAESFPLYWSHRDDWHIIIGGKTIVGAIIGGWVGVEIAKERLNLSHPSGDIYVFPLILGMCIGRVGCFSAGLEDGTYGIATTLPWGVDFGDHLLRHPTQLYEVAFLLLTAAFFAWRILTRRQHGCMFSQFMFAYLAFRFFVEFIKPRYTLPVVPLSAIQLASLGGIAYAIVHWNDRCCGKATLPTPPHHTGPQFLELTNSLCPMCLRKIEAKVLADDHGVYMQKFCPDHGMHLVTLADDVAYWKESRQLYKPPTSPLRRNTPMRQGCPFDCGLCPDHEQHSCLAIVEITEQCDQHCPICFACSEGNGEHRTLSEIEKMLDAVVANEGKVNVVQISGGEPTLHPDLFAILDMVKARPIRHIMLNTNGRRIAQDPEFVARLRSYLPGFEVYLQFDSLNPQHLRELRGTDLSGIRRQAIDNLNRHGISTTLVVTLKKGVNDGDIGEILDFAIAQTCVRGVTFQPIQAAGRIDGFDAGQHRLTLTEVRREILRQHKLFTAKDLLPVPCHTDALAMAYALRVKGKMYPLSTIIDPRGLMNLGGNTICYEQDPHLREQLQQLFSASASPSSAAQSIGEICCTPLPAGLADGIRYENVFRVIIMQFMDAWSMDLRSLKRSCVHIVHPDGRLIPFETYNLLYRNPPRYSHPASMNAI